MTERSYCDWVKPIAEADRESREELLTLARKLRPDDWQRPSGLEGWTLKDLLAHLAGGTGKNFQTVLECVLDRRPVDPAVLGAPDERNRQDVEERRDHTVAELIMEIEHEGAAVDLLLSRLTPEHEHLRQDNIPMSLGEGLSQNPGGHFREHLEHFKAALEDSR